jgi:AcrR family transcriptional regulator
VTAQESVRRESSRRTAPHSPPEPPIRKRRSSHEVEELILSTARELFAARGYAGVTTRDVAIEAGVNETSIYRRFGSKAGLFDAAVLEPYHKFMTAFMEAWKEDVRAPKSQRDVVRSFVVGLYDTLSENRDAILAYIYVHRFIGFESQADAADSVISREIEIMDKWVAEVSGAFGFKNLDDPVTLHCSFGLLMGMVLHQDLIFPAGPRRPSRERIIRELTTYVYHAIATR